jgi:hypothetical protein
MFPIGVCTPGGGVPLIGRLELAKANDEKTMLTVRAIMQITEIFLICLFIDFSLSF